MNLDDSPARTHVDFLVPQDTYGAFSKALRVPPENPVRTLEDLYVPIATSVVEHRGYCKGYLHARGPAADNGGMPCFAPVPMGELEYAAMKVDRSGHGFHERRMRAGGIPRDGPGSHIEGNDVVLDLPTTFQANDAAGGIDTDRSLADELTPGRGDQGWQVERDVFLAVAPPEIPRHHARIVVLVELGYDGDVRPRIRAHYEASNNLHVGVPRSNQKQSDRTSRLCHLVYLAQKTAPNPPTEPRDCPRASVYLANVHLQNHIEKEDPGTPVEYFLPLPSKETFL